MRYGLVFPVLLASPIAAEFYTIHDLFGEKPTWRSYSFAGEKGDLRHTNPRELATLQVGTLADINATTDTCKAIGARIQCAINTKISSADGTASAVSIQVTCPLDSQVAFDFRRARSCSCGTQVTPTNGNAKYCPCVVCPYGFGQSPISIDCTNPTPVVNNTNVTKFVIGNCAFLDCGFACNGTCSYNCQQAGPNCSFCANRSNAPTPPPNNPNAPQLTGKPTRAPTGRPRPAPTGKPTRAPTGKPTRAPTGKPTRAPTAKPTRAPTGKPTPPPPGTSPGSKSTLIKSAGEARSTWAPLSLIGLASAFSFF